jgi:proline dehydrogenase
MPVLGYAARKYVAGNALGDAVDLAKRAAAQGLSCTMCYWNDGSEDPEVVAAEYGSILDYLGQSSLDGALAAKIPALWERDEQVAGVVALARSKRVPVIFDAHAPEQSDATLRFLERHGGDGLGLAIPGRWRRSLRDADRAIELGARVRVVKGEWVDPEEPGMDLREGYLRVIRRLAGRARFVGVATHDAVLAAQAMQILAEAGTPFEQEFVFPLPIAAARREGERFGVGARLYIPYGEAWLPYSIKRAFRNPQVFYWLTRDLLVGKKFELPANPAGYAPAAS